MAEFDHDILLIFLIQSLAYIDFAVNVEVPDESIVERMSGRRACLNCGGTYNSKVNSSGTKSP